MDFHDYQVYVDNPQKHLEPLDTYISFRVTTKVKQTDNENDDREYIVRRRYSDFLWLRNKLIEAHPTLFVPALPSKHSAIEQLDRYSSPFIMNRMALLHPFLQRVTLHPVFSCSPVLKLFLTAKSTEFNTHSRCNKVVDRFPSPLHSFWDTFNTGYNLRHSHCYSEFDSVSDFTSKLHTTLYDFQGVSGKECRRRSELSNDLEDGKRAIESWICQEPELMFCLGGIRDALSEVIVSQEKHLLQTHQTSVNQPLQEYLSYVAAIDEALKRRNTIQNNYETSVSETNKKLAEKEQIKIVDNSNGFITWKESLDKKKLRIPELEKNLQLLETTVEENHDKLEIANESIRSDIERWHGERKKEMKNLLTNIADNHIQYYQECLQAWEKALETLKTSNNESDCT